MLDKDGLAKAAAMPAALECRKSRRVGFMESSLLGFALYHRESASGWNNGVAGGSPTKSDGRVATKQNLYTVALYVDDTRYDKRNRSVNEPIYFFARGKGHTPVEFVVNQVGKNKISGYLSVLKTQSTHARSAGN